MLAAKVVARKNRRRRHENWRNVGFQDLELAHVGCEYKVVKLEVAWRKLTWTANYGGVIEDGVLDVKMVCISKGHSVGSVSRTWKKSAAK